MEKSEDARKIKDWEGANKHLSDFKTGFYQDRDIQGDTLHLDDQVLREQKEKGEKKELELADEMAQRIRDDQRSLQKGHY